MGCGDGVRRRAGEPKARQPLGTAPELHEFHGRPLRALRSLKERSELTVPKK